MVLISLSGDQYLCIDLLKLKKGDLYILIVLSLIVDLLAQILKFIIGMDDVVDIIKIFMKILILKWKDNKEKRK